MVQGIVNTLDMLNRDYLQRYPDEALRIVADLNASELSGLLRAQSIQLATRVWDSLSPELAAEVVEDLDDQLVKHLLTRSDPVHTARFLAYLSGRMREKYLALLDPVKSKELSLLLGYPENSAGAIMDPRFLTLHGHLSVRDALLRIRKLKPRFTRQLFLVSDEGKLQQMVELQDMALAEPGTTLASISKPVQAAMLITATREEVVTKFEEYKITDLPVVDVSGILVGVIRNEVLISAAVAESSADILTMVGANKDERAFSKPLFVVRKRLPWLQINLVTAFIAAAVVGLFENTIAQFPALAVLLPVVAGQSGNTGAQALAVTMRGLALHEIGTSHWRHVAIKEISAGFINGVAVALVTAIGVLVWSSSPGLAIVIAVAMVISMVAAGFAGVIIPIILSSLGQDPAQSSSIILTTITDVTGFFTFLGLATLMMGFL